ncbi:hypothetical protein AC229_1763 [Oenococcus oeni]|nr:hypothetical protein AC229_1763 [Oenococcus oeni]
MKSGFSFFNIGHGDSALSWNFKLEFINKIVNPDRFFDR